MCLNMSALFLFSNVIVIVHRTTDELSELLSSCDYIVNLLPSTNSTRGMLNGDMLRHGQCKVRNHELKNSLL